MAVRRYTEARHADGAVVRCRHSPGTCWRQWRSSRGDHGAGTRLTWRRLCTAAALRTDDNTPTLACRQCVCLPRRRRPLVGSNCLPDIKEICAPDRCRGRDCLLRWRVCAPRPAAAAAQAPQSAPTHVALRTAALVTRARRGRRSSPVPTEHTRGAIAAAPLSTPAPPVGTSASTHNSAATAPAHPLQPWATRQAKPSRRRTSRSTRRPHTVSAATARDSCSWKLVGACGERSPARTKTHVDAARHSLSGSRLSVP